MSGTIQQYQISGKGGQFSLVWVPYPTPSAGEVCFRTKAMALNPIDWKNRVFGLTVPSWPAVLGVDSSGVVESVGADVVNLKPGDEVFGFCDNGNQAGAFQDVRTVPLHLVAKKPASLSHEEAASLPLCYLTAAAAISVGLRVPLPHLDCTTTGSSLNSVLVLGGSSGVGAAAIQLLRLALPSAIILTTGSVKHHSHLVSLGATKCFERSAQDDTSPIRAASPGACGVDAILDAVAAAASQPAVFTALNPNGLKVYSQVFTGDNIAVPEGTQSTLAFCRQMFGREGGMDAMSGLVSLVESGKYVLPGKVEILGGGYGAIASGLEKVMMGVSGKRLVVTM